MYFLNIVHLVKERTGAEAYTTRTRTRSTPSPGGGAAGDQDADTINAIARECGLDLGRLSGSEPWEVCALIDRPVLKCLKVRHGQTAAEVLAQVRPGALLLLDPYVE